MDTKESKKILKSLIGFLRTKCTKIKSRNGKLRDRLLFFVIALLFFGHFNVKSQTWQNLGPKNEAGCMTGLFLHSASNKLFASSPDGGLWRANISSAYLSWTPISDFLDNIEIRAFAVAPSNSNSIYVANKSNSLYKTTNGGVNWTRIAPFDTSFGRVNKILVGHDADGWIYVGTTSGLFLSSNFGNSWEQVRSSEDVLDIAMDSDDSRILYIGVRSKGVFKTENRGTAWTPTPVLPWNQTRTIDSDWNPPRIRPSEMIKIALGETRPDGTDETPQSRTVAVKFGKRIYISQSAGATFVDKSATIITEDNAGYYTRTESLVNEEWVNAIAVDPFNSDHIMVGQGNLFNTTNLGNNWQVISYYHDDMQAIQFHRTTRNLVFLANDGGVERSTTATPSFNPIYSNLITAQLLRVGIAGDLAAGMAVGNSDHNGVIGTRSLPNGQWQRATPRKSSGCGYGNDNMERMGVYADPHSRRNNRFYIFHDTHIARLIFPNSSSDPCDRRATMFSNFAPYIVSPSPETPQQGIAVDTRNNSQLLLACADADNIVRSDCKDICTIPANTSFKLMLTRNGGIEPAGTFDPKHPDRVRNLPRWETTAESMDDPFVSVSFSPRNTGMAFAITKSGALFTTSFPLPLPTTVNWTRHNHWVTSVNGDGVRHMAIHPDDDNRVYAITENTLAKTSNRGATWTAILRNIPTQKYYSIVATKESLFFRGTILFLGTSDGVYKTYDEGITWTKKNGNLPNVKVVQLVIDGNYLYAVTFGRGIWRIPLSQL